VDGTKRLQPGPSQRDRGGYRASLDFDLALAHRGQRNLGQLDQIAARADAADLADDGVDTGVEHAGQQLDRCRGDARVAER